MAVRLVTLTVRVYCSQQQPIRLAEQSITLRTGAGMSDHTSTEFAPLLAGQATADAAAAHAEALSEQHFAAQALIPLQRRLEAAYAAEDASLPAEADDDDFEPDACFYCQSTVDVTVHRYIHSVYAVCDDADCQLQHERTCPEAAALAAE